ncbi:MAG: glycoside hydrolase family 76 protein [Clostridiales bacterium]|nr:glycoside hydrolase family 76 protein [Clostridiales bacterium]
MKKSHILMASLMLSFWGVSCSSDEPDKGSSDSDQNKPTVYPTVAETNLSRAMHIIDAAVDNYFDPQSMSQSRKYNPYTGNKSSETGSVWMYTSAIEAVNATAKAMQDLKAAGMPSLYDANFERYTALLDKLIENLEYYAGTYTLTSYTQTKSWTVYAVNRASGKGGADVTGILNVYDDQQWLVRELIEAYRITGKQSYLDKAEYLTAYVLDGWDCTLDANGKEHGGITWGPGYTTKHSCSNGPMVSPLVWLSEIYKGKTDEITYRYITSGNKRVETSEPKSSYYLTMAAKIYDWQKEKLFNSNVGVYYDMLGAEQGIKYETVDGTRYRRHNRDDGPTGKYYSYNTGTMLSGAAALAEATGDSKYKNDAVALTTSSFNYFAHESSNPQGYYDFELTGFSPWFNGVLMRAYAEAYEINKGAAGCLDAFQKNLDYACDNFWYKDMLPVNPLAGWNRDKAKNDTEVMFTFVNAAELSVLASYNAKK